MKARMIANHGQSKQYYHDKIGVNSRLDSIHAAILRCKLPYLDEYIKHRNWVASVYDEAFNDVDWLEIPFRNSNSTHVFHQYTLRILNSDRDGLVQHLNDNNIPCGVYYPIPLHNQKAYQDSRYNEADFTVTNQLVKEVISLPMHTELDDEQINFITKTIIDFLRK